MKLRVRNTDTPALAYYKPDTPSPAFQNFTLGYGDIGNPYLGTRFKAADGFAYGFLGFPGNFLSRDLSFICYPEQHRAAFLIEKGTKRFHTAFQLSGSFLELNLICFGIRCYQVFNIV